MLLRAILVCTILQISLGAKCDLKKIFQVPHEKDKLQILERSNFDEEPHQQKHNHYPQHNKPHAVANAQVLLQFPEITSRIKDTSPSHVPYYVIPTGAKDNNLEKVLIPASYFPIFTSGSNQNVPPLIYPGCPCPDSKTQDSNSVLKESEKKMWDNWIKTVQNESKQSEQNDDDLLDRMGPGRRQNKNKDDKTLNNLSSKDIADIINLGKSLLGEAPTVSNLPKLPIMPPPPSENQNSDGEVLKILPNLIKNLQGIGKPGFSKSEVDIALAMLDDFVKKNKGSLEAVYPSNSNLFNTIPLNTNNTSTNNTNTNNTNTNNTNPNNTNTNSTVNTTTTTTSVTNIETTTLRFSNNNGDNTTTTTTTPNPNNTNVNNASNNDASFRMFGVSKKRKPNNRDEEIIEIKENLFELSNLVRQLIETKLIDNIPTSTTTSPFSSTIPITEKPLPVDTNNNTLNNLLLLLNGDETPTEVSRANLENLVKFLEDYLRLKTIASLIDPSFIFPTSTTTTTTSSPLPSVPTLPTVTKPTKSTGKVTSTTCESTTPLPPSKVDCGNPIIAEIGGPTCPNIPVKPNIIKGCHSNYNHFSLHRDGSPQSSYTTHKNHKDSFVHSAHKHCSSHDSQSHKDYKYAPPILEEIRNGYVCPKCVQQSLHAAQLCKDDKGKNMYFNHHHQQPVKKEEKLVIYNPCDDDDDSYEAVSVLHKNDKNDHIVWSSHKNNHDSNKNHHESKHYGSCSSYNF